MTDQPTEKTQAEQNIERMDKICASMLDLIEREDTPAKLKPTLFSQVQQWYKVRDKLIPDKRGNRLEEMANERKYAQGSGSRKPGSAKKPRAAPSEGRAIRSLIKKLPPIGGNVLRDTQDSERESGGADFNGGFVRVNGGGDDTGHDDEPNDRALV